MTTARRMTVTDLLDQPDDGYLYELVRGEILRMPPPKGDHGRVELALAGAIDRYLYGRAATLGWDPSEGRTARDRLVGYPESGEAGIRFSLPDDPDQIRGVDVLYLTPEQFARLEPILRTEYIPEVPALVAEVISASETTTYSNEKVTDYLNGGARLVWQLFPLTRTIRVYGSDNTTWTIPAGGTLDGGAVLPGFTVGLGELFD
jgi:Uma2 family endonuclease